MFECCFQQLVNFSSIHLACGFLQRADAQTDSFCCWALPLNSHPLHLRCPLTTRSEPRVHGLVGRSSNNALYDASNERKAEKLNRISALWPRRLKGTQVAGKHQWNLFWIGGSWCFVFSDVLSLSVQPTLSNFSKGHVIFLDWDGVFETLAHLDDLSVTALADEVF